MSEYKKPEFELTAPYQPTGDQPQAISELVHGLREGIGERVLLGVTGSGKTYTIANVIAQLQRPTLVISHNKTLAAQLYQEFKEFFPNNAVSYFVSYYDYYQPEAYLPQTDTYIEKETEVNQEIDKMRLAATTNILTRNDTIIVASVSCIYNIGSPREYGNFVLELLNGVKISLRQIMERLVALQYERNEFAFNRGTFRVRGGTIDLYPAYEDIGVRIVTDGDHVAAISRIDAVTGEIIAQLPGYVVYPAKHYMTDPAGYREVFAAIRHDLDQQVNRFNQAGKILEANRIKQRVTYDLEMINEIGYVNGIENYSRYFDGRQPGDPPYTLLDYFSHIKNGKKNEWLLVIDESHMTIPQIRGMYNGDRSRKQTLIDFGFRLPSALDNRPLRFDEFLRNLPDTIYVSATPDEWEISRATAVLGGIKSKPVVEQLIRPTGLVDPEISLRPSSGQVKDLTREIENRVALGQRTLVTTLTKRMAEDLAGYLEEKGIKVHYLHAEILTLDRTEILTKLRSGIYDVIIGVNLLREGLDLPEVSLVAILDADKEGFLRSRTSLIQTMGRAARNVAGEVILYADNLTGSIQAAMEEVRRRREVQVNYNRRHGITPKSIEKPVRPLLAEKQEAESADIDVRYAPEKIEAMTPYDKMQAVKKLTQDMKNASREMRYEDAAKIRDLIKLIRN